MFGKKYLAGDPMRERIHLKKGRNVFVMQCGFHPYMFSWGLVAKNPYFSVTKEDGKFEITDIPPGDYVLVRLAPRDETVFRSKGFRSGEWLCDRPTLCIKRPRGGEVPMRLKRTHDLGWSY